MFGGNIYIYNSGSLSKLDLHSKSLSCRRRRRRHVLLYKGGTTRVNKDVCPPGSPFHCSAIHLHRLCV